MKDIVIQLINAKNVLAKQLGEVEKRLAEVREQQRNIVSEFRLKGE